jgi:hypothetical protein
MKTIKLTNKQQIEVLKTVRGRVEYRKLGLCHTICNVLELFGISVPPSLISCYIPLFTRENAIKYAGANSSNIYWWPYGAYDRVSRLQFLDFMINELKKKNNETY